jgi:hypothetical protein
MTYVRGWPQPCVVVCGGLFAGAGFTMALFIASLAFSQILIESKPRISCISRFRDSGHRTAERGVLALKSFSLGSPLT